jgi:hypothetical protein
VLGFYIALSILIIILPAIIYAVLKKKNKSAKTKNLCFCIMHTINIIISIIAIALTADCGHPAMLITCAYGCLGIMASSIFIFIPLNIAALSIFIINKAMHATSFKTFHTFKKVKHVEPKDNA